VKEQVFLSKKNIVLVPVVILSALRQLLNPLILPTTSSVSLTPEIVQVGIDVGNAFAANVGTEIIHLAKINFDVPIISLPPTELAASSAAVIELDPILAAGNVPNVSSDASVVCAPVDIGEPPIVEAELRSTTVFPLIKSSKAAFHPPAASTTGFAVIVPTRNATKTAEIIIELFLFPMPRYHTA